MRAIIIEDNRELIGTLQSMLAECCRQVTVVAAALNGEEGIKAIKQHEPDLVFLDINMPGMNGFDMLAALGDYRFSVIFVTGYDEFAIRAFRISAVDYLLKPLDIEELKLAVGKAIRHREAEIWQTQLKNIQMILAGAMKEQHLVALESNEATKLKKPADIVKFRASGSYTRVFLKDGKEEVVSKNLNYFQGNMKEYGFIRCHNSWLVNPAYVTGISKKDGGDLVLSNGEMVPISKRRASEVKKLLIQHKKLF